MIDQLHQRSVDLITDHINALEIFQASVSENLYEESADDLVDIFKQFDKFMSQKTTNEDWLPDRLDFCHIDLMTNTEKITSCIDAAISQARKQLDHLQLEKEKKSNDIFNMLLKPQESNQLQV